MCVSPIIVKSDNVHGQKYNLVGCGKCFQCLQKFQNDWSVRLSEEFKCHKDVFFVTFTYNNNTVPTVVDKHTGETHYSVCKSHIQKILKRFRINYLRKNGKIIYLKYFLTAEYGPATLRPHYHALFFGLSQFEVQDLCKLWQSEYGFTCLKRVRGTTDDAFSTSRYVAKYCSKGSFENPYVKQKKVHPVFRLISKGIGINYVVTMKSFHLASNFPVLDKYVKDSDGFYKYSQVYIDTVVDRHNILLKYKDKYLKFSIPRYYKEKIYGSQNTLSSQIAETILQRDDDLRCQRAKQLQTENPSWSFDKAYGFTFIQDNLENHLKNEQSRELLYSFYRKSKI